MTKAQDHSDASLVRRAQEGDEAAFEALLDRHFDSAFAVARGVAIDTDEAEDICQDAFVRAWQRLHQCRHPERFRGWLMRVVRSVGLNQIQARKRRRQTALDALPLESDAPAPGRRAERRELREQLERALAALPEVQRQAVLLYDLQGWKHAEIADMLGISEFMSRRHVSDGRKALRARLTDTGAAQEAT